MSVISFPLTILVLRGNRNKEFLARRKDADLLEIICHIPTRTSGGHGQQRTLRRKWHLGETLGAEIPGKDSAVKIAIFVERLRSAQGKAGGNASGSIDGKSKYLLNVFRTTSKHHNPIEPQRYSRASGKTVLHGCQ